MIKKYYCLFFAAVFLILAGCETEEGASVDMASEDPNANPPAVEQESPEYFAITNEFEDHKGRGRMFLYLTGRNEQSYIVPPTQYSSVELKYVIMDSVKVEGECVQVPKEAFPLAVSVCETDKCKKIRPLDVVLTNPAHYNINGIGGLVTPRIAPFSPCSKEFFDLIEDVQPYQAI